MGSKRRKILYAFVTLIIFNSSILSIIPENTSSNGYEFFTLSMAVPVWDIEAVEYSNFIKQYLARIGIRVNIIARSNVLCPYPLQFDGFHGMFTDDLAYYSFSNANLLEYVNRLFRENGSLNYCRYDITMDYDEDLGTGINEWYIDQINTLSQFNRQNLQQTCWEWQNHLMYDILPCIPLFGEPLYKTYWNNLEGYNASSGLIQSWGKMSWDGLHPGQESIGEIIIADKPWCDLNPIVHSEEYGTADEFITKLILDPLIYRDGDYTYWPHLVSNWEQLEENHIRLTLREGIKWNIDPDGIFPNEYFDSDDVYFTLNLAKMSKQCYWLDSLQIINSSIIDLHIKRNRYYKLYDGFLYPYPHYLDDLANIVILPEHYLNQTQFADGITPDRTHPSWEKFSQHCFGTGLFEINNFIENKETELKIQPNSWYLNSSIINDPKLNWNDRFGNYLGELDTLTIRILPNFFAEGIEFEAGKVDILEINQLPSKPDNQIGLTKDIQLERFKRFDILILNMRSYYGYIGSRDPAPCNPSITIGLALRRAIAYSINKKEMNQIINANNYVELNHPISPNLGNWLNPNIARYCYNRDIADLYMKIAGFYLGWCVDDCPPIPYYEIPDWEEVCNPDYEYKETISVNGFTPLIMIFSTCFLVVIGILAEINKMKRRRRN
ncbi:MAG: hypothetical protein FK733_12150 [Asgard group archaeon]|nr:hypothetical protein [Asgard group archaeon]